jgi:HEAT repeat protein
MSGRGEVKSPTGQFQKLGQADTADKWIKKLTDVDPFNREAGAQALGWLGNSTAVPALCKALGDPMPLVRRSAAESLGRIGDASALEALKALAEDKHAWTAETVKWAQEKIGPPKSAQERR